MTRNQKMNIPEITYKTKTASLIEICTHLSECSSNFDPRLVDTVDIQGYSSKIFDQSITFEAWAENSLIGLLAAYFNDTRSQLGYITNVSINKSYMDRGIASHLMEKCILYAKQNGYTEIRLEVKKDNRSAIHLYEKFGFTQFEHKDRMVLMQLLIIGKQ